MPQESAGDLLWYPFLSSLLLKKHGKTQEHLEILSSLLCLYMHRHDISNETQKSNLCKKRKWSEGDWNESFYCTEGVFEFPLRYDG